MSEKSYGDRYADIKSLKIDARAWNYFKSINKTLKIERFLKHAQ